MPSFRNGAYVDDSLPLHRICSGIRHRPFGQQELAHLQMSRGPVPLIDGGSGIEQTCDAAFAFNIISLRQFERGLACMGQQQAAHMVVGGELSPIQPKRTGA